MTDLEEKLKQYGFPEPDSISSSDCFNIAHWHIKDGSLSLTAFDDRECFEFTIQYQSLVLSDSVSDEGANTFFHEADFKSVANFIRFLKGE